MEIHQAASSQLRVGSRTESRQICNGSGRWKGSGRKGKFSRRLKRNGVGMVIDCKSALETLGHLLIRVYMIFMGYLAGVISFGLSHAIITVLLREDGVSRSIQLPSSTVPFILLSLYSFFRPVLLIVSVAEILGYRSVAYYAGTWALTGYAISSDAKPFLPPPRYDVLFAYQGTIWTLCAILGGVAYWAVAGRLARRLHRAPKKNERGNHLKEQDQYTYRRP